MKKNRLKIFFTAVKDEGLMGALKKTKNFFYRIILICSFRYLPKPLLAMIFTSGTIQPIKDLPKDILSASIQNKEVICAPIEEKYSISSQYVCIFGESANFAGKEVVIVAHWDPDNIIDPYVVYQCKNFIKLGKEVILISSHPIQECHALSTSHTWCHAIIYRTCPGYDFTSWKAGLDCFPSLFEAKELTLTNDSYFGPINSFGNTYKRMEIFSCDFWGMNYSLTRKPHLQSFFIVLKKQVLKHYSFADFFNSVPLDNSRKLAVLFEISFTLWLALHGFTPAAFCRQKKLFHFELNFPTYYPHLLIEYGVPIFKKNSIANIHEDIECMSEKNRHSIYLSIKNKFPNAYPWELLDNYLQRINFKF